MRVNHDKALVYVLAAAALLAGVPSRGLSQGISPSLSSNIDETTGTTSRSKLPPPGTAGPIALPDDFSKLRLQPSDSVNMEVFDVPLLSESMTVDASGDIVVPLIGPVHVQGETLREAERQIASLLIDRQIVKNPTVNLAIGAYARPSITISGEVQAPGKIQILAPHSLLDVLALAGGETPAAGGMVEIRHNGSSQEASIERVPYAAGKDPTAASAAMVYPGDDVYVRRAGVVYILGAVARPGGYLMVNGGTLTVPQAISLAQGTTLIASNKEVLIVRKRDGQITRITAPLMKQEKGDSATVSLSDGDFLYVPTSKLKAIFVNTQSILSSAASAGIVTGLQR